MTDEPSKDPVLRGIIAREKTNAVRAATIYGVNSEGARTALVLPGVNRNADFVPDSDGVNINGAYVARWIYQARLASDPSAYGPSRGGAWWSTVWNAGTATPTSKASHYCFSILSKGFMDDPDLPQEHTGLLAKVQIASGLQHGKAGGAIFGAMHERAATTTVEEAHGLLTEGGDVLEAESTDSLLEEDAAAAYAFTNGKLYCQQNVLVFDGPDVGWNYDLDQDDDEASAVLDDTSETASARSLYPGYGATFNNAGLTPGFAAAAIKARKPSVGGTPWTHGVYIKKEGVKAFSFRHQKNFGVCAIGFDPGDGSGARAMPYMGVGTDVADTPLHLRGPVALTHRFEYGGDASTPYQLGGLSFYGRASVGVATREMTALRVDVVDPTRGNETAQVSIASRVDGRSADRLHIGEGLWTDGVDGGDKGPGALNLQALFVDGELELGVDPLAADPVTPVSVAQTAKGMVVKSQAPDDRRFRGVWIARSTLDDPSTAVTIDFIASRPGKKIKFVDTDALTSGQTYYYFEASSSRREVESPVWTLIGSDVFYLIRDPDIDQTLPANAALAPALAQILTIDTVSGLPVLQLQATITAEGSETAYVVALQRNGAGYAPQRIEATPTSTLVFWNVNVGDACQVKHRLINALGRKSAAYGSVASLTISGDTTPPAQATAPSGQVNAKPDGTLVAKGWVWPTDKDLIGGLLWLGTTSSPSSATTYAGFVSLHNLHARIDDGLTIGVDTFVFLDAIDSSGNVASSAPGVSKVLVGDNAPRLIQGGDVGANQIDAGVHLTGVLPQGQALSLSNGNAISTAAATIRTTCSDGDTVTFPFDLGDLPDVDFLLGSLPPPSSGNAYVATATSLTSTGFIASIKQITPVTITPQNSGLGASDSSIPSPGMPPNGFSVVKGVTPSAYNSGYQAKLNLSFTTTLPTKLGAAIVRVYRWNGASWTKLADVMFVAGATGAYTGVSVGGWASSVAMAATDKWGFQVLSFNPGTTGCTINSLNSVTYKTQTTSSSASGTPNGEDVTVLIWPKNL